MKRLLLLIALCLGPYAYAVTATITVAEDPYFAGKSAYNGYRSGDAPAPLPVFFRGGPWVDEAALYEWTFGDGATLTGPYYSNAAHVFEAPGAYTVTLKVTGKDGTQHTAGVMVNARARTGRTFYVDAQAGADNKAGTSEANAWRTVAYATGKFGVGFYQPGDRILFKRGQTHPMVDAGAVPRNVAMPKGVLLGAYGDGAKPVLKYQSGPSKLLEFSGGGAAGTACMTFMDLSFDLQSDTGARAGELFWSNRDIAHILFLRVDFKRASRFIAFSQGNVPGVNRAHGVYFFGCTFGDSQATQIFLKAADAAIVDCVFDYSGNHIVYSEHIDHGFIVGNTFSRPAWGRTALRVTSGGGWDYPSQNAVIVDNQFLGWVDPRTSAEGTAFADGTRYNYRIVDIGTPNAAGDKWGRRHVFAGNTVTNAETLIGTAALEDCLFVGNTLTTPNAYKDTGAGLIQIGDPGNKTFGLRPSKRITIEGNRFTGGASKNIPAIAISNYGADSRTDGDDFGGQHEGIAIRGNTLAPSGAPGVWLETGVPASVVTTPQSEWFSGVVTPPVDPPVDPEPEPEPPVEPEPPAEDMATQAELDAATARIAVLEADLAALTQASNAQSAVIAKVIEEIALLKGRVQTLETQRDAVKAALN